ncbi:uncharacterized protein DNG_05746 [Cephalotrichum gorgonifer]|uniref:Uncharacterized protein n=1 Tax=Cephalotrichum gorgonifer TaxID=2041049 RepID=A0AAE8MYS0_9PEZI|nr:uncharacterized protein DNG_05746 [Cephalotrichum gorgonifer]
MDESQIPPRGPHHSPRTPGNGPQESSYRPCILDSDPVFWMYDPQTTSAYSPNTALYEPSSPLYKPQPSSRQSPQDSLGTILNEPSSSPYGSLSLPFNPQSSPRQSSLHSPQISLHSLRSEERRSTREVVSAVMESLEDDAEDVYRAICTADEVSSGSETARRESQGRDTEHAFEVHSSRIGPVRGIRTRENRYGNSDGDRFLTWDGFLVRVSSQFRDIQGSNSSSNSRSRATDSYSGRFRPTGEIVLFP